MITTIIYVDVENDMRTYRKIYLFLVLSIGICLYWFILTQISIKPIRSIQNVVLSHGKKYLFNVVFSGSLCMQTKLQTPLTLNNQKTL